MYQIPNVVDSVAALFFFSSVIAALFSSGTCVCLEAERKNSYDETCVYKT